MRRIAAVLVFVLAAGVFWANNYTRSHLPPNVYLGTKNLGNQEIKSVLKWLNQSRNSSVKIKVVSRIYPYSYPGLGVEFNLNQTYTALVSDSRLSFPHNLWAFWRARFSSRTILPQMTFGESFYRRFEAERFDFSQNKDEVKVNPTTKELVYENNQDLFVIDPSSLKKEILTNFGQKVILKPMVHRVIDDSQQLKVADYNRQINQVLEKPIAVYYTSGQAPVKMLSRETLEELVNVSYSPETQLLSLDVDQAKLDNLLRELNGSLGLQSDVRLDSNEFKTGLVSVVSSRFNGYQVDALYAHLVESPNTDGSEAPKYIEVDLSQQKMYLWENGNIVQLHRVSTGLYYPTPAGRYQILNKANNAYSYIYNVWMPYWMAFSLDKKVNAYLGIHELPYWVDTSGQEIRRPRDFIGSPHTGGCVSLDVGEAQQVYVWAEIGTPVLIFD